VSHAQQIGVLPLSFATAVHDLTSFPWHPQIRITELEPPAHIAPYSAAVDADIITNDEEIGSGRLILLYDPMGNESWQGDFRCVTFAQAEVTADMVHDPFLAYVGWSWLTDALSARGAIHTGESGTITTTASTPFGAKQHEGQQSQIEIRASWTPLIDDNHQLTEHLFAWQDLLRQVGGLPPADDTVIPLTSRIAARR
jgi:hypothetical protein